MKRFVPFTGITLFLFCLLVRVQAQVIVAGPAFGNLSACAGSASTKPFIQQFTVSGSSLAGNITAAAPAGFQLSLSAGSGYGSSVSLVQAGGSVNTTVFVCSAASDPPGNISGNVVLSTQGLANQFVAVKGTVNALPTVNPVPNQVLLNGDTTSPVKFTGTGNTFTWTNDTPSIGLAASGVVTSTGVDDLINSFTAVNNTGSPVTATITVTPLNAPLAYIPGGVAKLRSFFLLLLSIPSLIPLSLRLAC